MIVFTGLLYLTIDKGFVFETEKDDDFYPSDIIFLYVKAFKVWFTHDKINSKVKQE